MQSIVLAKKSIEPCVYRGRMSEGNCRCTVSPENCRSWNPLKSLKAKGLEFDWQVGFCLKKSPDVPVAIAPERKWWTRNRIASNFPLQKVVELTHPHQKALVLQSVYEQAGHYCHLGLGHGPKPMGHFWRVIELVQAIIPFEVRRTCQRDTGWTADLKFWSQSLGSRKSSSNLRNAGLGLLSAVCTQGQAGVRLVSSRGRRLQLGGVELLEMEHFVC